MNKYKLLLLSVLIVSACKNSSMRTGTQDLCCIKTEYRHIEKSFATFSELLQSAYFSRDDEAFPELCRLLNDTILSHKKKIWLWTTSKIDTVNHCIFWEFNHVDPEQYVGSRFSDRFVFNVCITNENDIITNKCENDIATIKQQAIEYLFYPNEEDKHIIIKRQDIDLIGEIEVASTGVILSRDVENNLSIDEWKLFFDCLHELMLAYEEERNKKSVKIWGIEYHLLSCEKMEVLANVIDYNIIIDFFQTMTPPSPPFPPDM